VVLLRHDVRSLHVESFLMSCRVMGRGIETALMNHVKHRLLDGRALDLRARYVPTPKNQPVETFFDDQGFHLCERHDSGEKHYALGRSEVQLRDCDWIRVLSEELAGSR